MSGDWIPPGYVSVVSLMREHGAEKVRNDLFSGRLVAFKLDGTQAQLYPIEPEFWCGDRAEWFLERGLFPHFVGGLPPCRIVVRVAEDETKPQPSTDGSYLSPFMRLILDAVRHFSISEEQWPKKQELKQYFLEQKLPGGTPVSPNVANNLATFCRPLAAKSGGNKKG